MKRTIHKNIKSLMFICYSTELPLPRRKKCCLYLFKNVKQILIISTDHQQPCQRDAVVLFFTLVSGWHLLGVPFHPSDLPSQNCQGEILTYWEVLAIDCWVFIRHYFHPPPPPFIFKNHYYSYGSIALLK